MQLCITKRDESLNLILEGFLKIVLFSFTLFLFRKGVPSLFGFTNPPFPSDRHRQALSIETTKRNLINAWNLIK